MSWGVAVDEHLGMMDPGSYRVRQGVGRRGEVLVLNFGDVHNYGSHPGGRDLKYSLSDTIIKRCYEDTEYC